MRNWLFCLVFAAQALAAQERIVDRTAIWVDTAQRGDMQVLLRAPGVLLADGAVELRVPAAQLPRVSVGQSVAVSSQLGVVKGKIVRVDHAVRVELSSALPPGSQAGQAVDGAIQLDRLADVTHVGRPVVCSPDGEGTIFKIEPDGQSARQVKVLYGKASINMVEIREGLTSGDRVILSDMSAFRNDARVRLR